MPMSPKGKVPITVDGVRYRVAQSIRRGDVRLIVQQERGGRRMEAAFDPFVFAGRESEWHDYPAKGLVAIVIREALGRGWRPEDRGPPFVLPQAALIGEHPRPAWAEGGRGRELLDAVLATPEPLGPRLVLADWLLERDDPRGTVIRAQCAGEEPRALLERHWRRWSAPVQRVARRWRFVRGFVDHVVLREPPDPAAWVALHGLEPVMHVAAHVDPRRAGWLRDLVHPSHREITLDGALDAGAVRELAASVGAARGPLPRLRIRAGLADDALAALLGAEGLAAAPIVFDNVGRGLPAAEHALVLQRRPAWR